METEASQLLSKAPPLGVEQVGIALEAVSVTPVRFLQLVIYSAAIFMSVLNYSVMIPIYNYGLDRFDDPSLDSESDDPEAHELAQQVAEEDLAAMQDLGVGYIPGW